jgi:hypothetical protein
MRRHLAATLAVVLGLLAGLTACSKDPDPKPVAQAFLDGFRQTKLDGVALEDPNGFVLTGAEVVEEIKVLTGDLVPSAAAMSLVGDPQVNEDRAEAKVTVDWKVADGVQWKYETTLKLRKRENGWRVVWAPSNVYRDLKEGDFLAVLGIRPQRGQILDGAGSPIVMARPVVIVGVEPQRITNQAQLLADLDSAFKGAGVAVDLSGLPAQIAAAKPDAFVNVVTLRREVYE